MQTYKGYYIIHVRLALTYPMAVADQDATLYMTLLPSQAFRSFPFFFFTEKVFRRAELEVKH